MLKGKTAIITGGSRGIGGAIGLRFAQEGANIVILTKDSVENVEAISEQIADAGGKVLVCDVDVSEYEQLENGVKSAVENFGVIDLLVNNTSATCFQDSLMTRPQQFDAMIATSVRAAFFLSQLCFPYLKEAQNPHIINISPPINLETHWLQSHLGFTMAKYAMSLCTLGMAAEFAGTGIAVNSLWPKTIIATQTITDHFRSKVYSAGRWPRIMGDAAYELVKRKAKECTGQFFMDEDLLRRAGVEDFSSYSVNPNGPLMQALFVPGAASIEKELFL